MGFRGLGFRGCIHIYIYIRIRVNGKENGNCSVGFRVSQNWGRGGNLRP